MGLYQWLIGTQIPLWPLLKETVHYWSYGVRNASTYSYGYSNYFNSLNSHYSSVTYDGLTRRVSASAGKTSMAQVDSIQAQNGRSATCRIGLN